MTAVTFAKNCEKNNNNYYNFNKYPVRLNDIIIITLFIIFKDSYLKKYFNNYN